MALKLIYLVVRNLLAWARLSRQNAAAKNVEILRLRTNRPCRSTVIEIDAIFSAEGIQILRSPVRAPRANAACERMIGTLRRAVRSRAILGALTHEYWIATAA